MKETYKMVKVEYKVPKVKRILDVEIKKQFEKEKLALLPIVRSGVRLPTEDHRLLEDIEVMIVGGGAEIIVDNNYEINNEDLLDDMAKEVRKMLRERLVKVIDANSTLEYLDSYHSLIRGVDFLENLLEVEFLKVDNKDKEAVEEVVEVLEKYHKIEAKRLREEAKTKRSVEYVGFLYKIYEILS